MTPKEKSKELFNKYYQKCADSSYPKYMAKDCALIAVDEILSLHKKVALGTLEFYLEVKQEIEKL
jgi:hypothetical protein